MYCVKCGMHLPENANFCPRCGMTTDIETASPVSPVKSKEDTGRILKIEIASPKDCSTVQSENQVPTELNAPVSEQHVPLAAPVPQKKRKDISAILRPVVRTTVIWSPS